MGKVIEMTPKEDDRLMELARQHAHRLAADLDGPKGIDVSEHAEVLGLQTALFLGFLKETQGPDIALDAFASILQTTLFQLDFTLDELEDALMEVDLEC